MNCSLRIGRRTVTAAAGLLLVTGCGTPLIFLLGAPSVLLSIVGAATLPPEAFDSVTVVGGNEARFVIARARLGNPFQSFNAFSPAAQVFPTDIVVTDSQTLESTQVVTLDSVFGFDLETDGQRLAWVDPQSGGVRVRDLDSGAEQRYFDGLASGADPYALRVIAIGDGRVVAAANNAGALLLLTIDLSDGTTRTLGPYLGGYVGPRAVRDGFVTLTAQRLFDPATDTPADFLEAPDVLLVDLSSGAESVLAPEAADYTNFGPSFSGPRVVWQNYNSDPGLEYYVVGPLRAVNLNDLSAATLVESDAARYITPETAGDAGILFSRYPEYQPPITAADFLALAIPIPEVTTYLLLRPNGELVELFAAEPDPLANPLTFEYSLPALIGDQAIIRDEFRGDFVAIDTNTLQQRRFAPFTP